MKRTATIGEYLTSAPHTIGVDQTIAFARETMRRHRLRHLPVLDAGRLVGVVSERDLAWLEGRVDAERTAVSEAMTSDPYVVEPTAPLREVAMTMAAGKFGATIVVDHGKVSGVFTTTDAMRALADALA